jgi:uroporphyrinogen-III decarboxylase
LFFELMGFERTCYELYEHPAKVEHLLEVLDYHHREIEQVCAESPALLVESMDSIHGQLMTPALFKQYAVPYFRRSSSVLHAKGEILACHIDEIPHPFWRYSPSRRLTWRRLSLPPR